MTAFTHSRGVVFAREWAMTDADCIAPDEPETVDHTPELLEALRKCQAALAMLTAPDAIKSSSVLHAWAHCVEAEAAARAAISKATGGE